MTSLSFICYLDYNLRESTEGLTGATTHEKSSDEDALTENEYVIWYLLYLTFKQPINWSIISLFDESHQQKVDQG